MLRNLPEPSSPEKEDGSGFSGPFGTFFAPCTALLVMQELFQKLRHENTSHAEVHGFREKMRKRNVIFDDITPLLPILHENSEEEWLNQSQLGLIELMSAPSRINVILGLDHSQFSVES